MNLITKLFEKRYKVSKTFIVSLSEVTEIKLSGMHTEGYTKSVKYPKRFIARKLKDNYKLITKDLTAYSNHQDTNNTGDLFVNSSKPLALFTNKKYMRESEILQFESYLNND